MKIIVGLGNPGEQYRYTRHNIGWLALDTWIGADEWRLEKRFNALIKRKGELLFIKPLSFMNESGRVVQKVMDYYGLLPKKLGMIRTKSADLSELLTVVHDELDIDFQKWRLSSDSSSAGHRGVQSIIDHLKTKKFSRLRLGIKNELLRTTIPAEKFVLQNFNKEERQMLDGFFLSASLSDLS